MRSTKEAQRERKESTWSGLGLGLELGSGLGLGSGLELGLEGEHRVRVEHARLDRRAATHHGLHLRTCALLLAHL